MKIIEYTPNAADKLRMLNQYITLYYGTKKAKEVTTKITRSIHGLINNENMGVSVKNMFDVSSDYRYIFVAKNYVFYRIENDKIKVIDIFHEKEDFIGKLFFDS